MNTQIESVVLKSQGTRMELGLEGGKLKVVSRNLYNGKEESTHLSPDNPPMATMLLFVKLHGRTPRFDASIESIQDQEDVMKIKRILEAILA